MEAQANRPPKPSDKAAPGEIWVHKLSNEYGEGEEIYVYGLNCEFVAASWNEDLQEIQGHECVWYKTAPSSFNDREERREAASSAEQRRATSSARIAAADASVRARQEHAETRAMMLGDILASLMIRVHDEPLSVVKAQIQSAIVDVTEVFKRFPVRSNLADPTKNMAFGPRRDGK